MSGGINAAVVAAGAKEARKALRSFFGRTLSTDEWRLVGRFDEEPRGDGLFFVRIDPSDPLRLEHIPTGQKMVVPFAEMLTDYASVPKLLQSLAKGSDVLHLEATRYKGPALFHDELYGAGRVIVVRTVTLDDGRTEPRAVVVPVSKRQADAVLYVCMECAGATLADALSYHGAVSLFGESAWQKCRKENEQWPLMLDLIRKTDKSEEKEEVT